VLHLLRPPHPLSRRIAFKRSACLIGSPIEQQCRYNPLGAARQSLPFLPGDREPPQAAGDGRRRLRHLLTNRHSSARTRSLSQSADVRIADVEVVVKPCSHTDNYFRGQASMGDGGSEGWDLGQLMLPRSVVQWLSSLLVLEVLHNTYRVGVSVRFARSLLDNRGLISMASCREIAVS
jgi:hypothetical protein